MLNGLAFRKGGLCKHYPDSAKISYLGSIDAQSHVDAVLLVNDWTIVDPNPGLGSCWVLSLRSRRDLH